MPAKLSRPIICLFCMFMLIFGLSPSLYADTNVGGEINTDTTWDLAGSPYMVTNSVSVVAGVKLTIESGVEIKFSTDTSLEIYGTLESQGTASNPITFTSDQATPSAESWSGIKFYDGSTGIFDHCVVEYASAGIYIHKSVTTTIQHSTFTNNKHGIEIGNDGSHIPTAIINYCSFYNNTEYNLYVTTLRGWSNTIINAQNNWWGTTDISEIDSGIYDYHEDDGLAIVDFSGFLDAENGNPIITSPDGSTYLIGGTTGDLTLSGTYLVNDSFQVQNGDTLTIDAGTVLKFTSGAFFRVCSGGTLVVNGTDASLVIFTSSASEPSVNDWGGIRFDKNASGSVSYAVVEYATTGVYIYQSSPTINYCTIQHNDKGIRNYVTGSPQILHCTIRNNTRGVEVENYNSNTPHPAVNNSSLFSNSEYNYYIIAHGQAWNTTLLDASNNWWGSSDPTEIAATIFDYTDQTNLAVVDFSLFLDGHEGNVVTTAPGGERYLSGGTWGDQVLSGTYLVNDSFQVQNGDTLTIDAGTVLKFTSGAFFRVCSGGTLVVNGTDASLVIFTSSASEPSVNDWGGIRFDKNASGSVSYAVVEYATTGVYIYQSSPTINYCTIQHNDKGIRNYVTGSPQILHCTIRNNTRGVEVENYNSNTPHPAVNNSSLFSNSEYNYYIIAHGQAWNTTLLDASNNWWGTQNPDEIAETIWDNTDQSSLAVVDFDPWLYNMADNDGPYVSEIKFNGTTVNSGTAITKPGSFSLYAVDAISGVSRVEFYINGKLKHTESKASGTFKFIWNIVEIPDGTYDFTVKAFDTLGNETELTLENLEVTLAPPAVPIVQYPTPDLLVSRRTVSVQGSAELYTEISVYNNNALSVTGIPVKSDGSFSISIPLVEGENLIEVAATHRGGTSARSDSVTVMMDPNALSAPLGLTLVPKPGGILRLMWQLPTGEIPAGYNVYRATAPFTEPPDATRLNSEPITTLSYEDLPDNEITYFYGVTSVDSYGNESNMTPVVHGTSDATPPVVESVEFTTTGAFDENTGRYAAGTLSLTVTVSEELIESPYFAIVPHNSTSIPIPLTPLSDTVYTGTFDITSDILAGPAVFKFSGKDAANNIGTTIIHGESIEIDTQGPKVTALFIDPDAPIKNREDSPVEITVTITLDEATRDNQAPALSYSYNDSSGEIPVSGLINIDDLQWQATFQLDAQAGLTQGDHLVFHVQTLDDLDNTGTLIDCPYSFEIYQGTLPPYEPPHEISGQSRPEGMVWLEWSPVDGAAYYRIYRRSPEETELSLYRDNYMLTEFSENPGSEGQYEYAVTCVRTANNEISESTVGQTVSIVCDDTPPESPNNFQLQLTGSGVKGSWEAPSGESDLTCRLYRSASPITSVDGLSAVAVSSPDELTVTDYHPSLDEHYYAVTAVDSAGNESLPSASRYLNFQLLPVSQLSVRLEEGSAPRLTWAAGGASIQGYNVYVRKDSGLVKLNPSLITDNYFEDFTYTPQEREYVVTSVDHNNNESIGRSIELPYLSFNLEGARKVYRGKVNSLFFNVDNLGDSLADNLWVELAGTDINVSSGQFDVVGNGSLEQKLVIGGPDALADQITLLAALKCVPEEGETVEFVKEVNLTVDDYYPLVELLIDNLVRGNTAAVKIKIFNDCDEEVDAVTATNSDSGLSHIHLELLDTDGNTLASRDLFQTGGTNIYQVPGGAFVARIPAHSSFTSDEISIPLPLNAPDQVLFRITVDHFYYHYAQSDQIKVHGTQSTKDITIVDTIYYAEVTDVQPEISRGNSDIVISGHAVSRKSGEELPYVPVRLGISENGFDRYYDLVTGEDGKFTFTYPPRQGESGVYTLWAIHPDLNFKAEQATFTIQTVYAPEEVTGNITRNISTPVSIKVQTGKGTNVHNLGVEIPDTLPQGISISLPDPIATLESGQKATLTFEIEADDSASASGQIALWLVSDETPGSSWQEIYLSYNVVTGQGFLSADPTYVEVGLQDKSSATATLTLENIGTAIFSDVHLSLVPPYGSPQLDWIELGVPEQIGNIALGEKVNITLQFKPDNVSEGIYEYILRAAGSNGPRIDIPIYVTVTSSETGGVKFHVSDIYTNTLDENGELIVGVDEAKIRIQNSNVPTEIYDAATSGGGYGTFENLPVGRYDYRITAPEHNTLVGVIHVSPGITADEEAFLETSLVTFQWEVVPITLKDTYTITLKATFETDVPAPVLVCEPNSVTLPDMPPGSTYSGSFRIINRGFTRADNLHISPPAGPGYSIPGNLPDELGPGDELTVPFHATKGEGGGCCAEGCYVGCFNISYSFVCANGVESGGSTNFCVSNESKECGEGFSINAITLSDNVIAVSGSGPGFSPEFMTVKGSDPCPPDGKHGKCDKKVKTGSGVTLVTGQYLDSFRDLKVKINGGWVYANRNYKGDRWYFGLDGESISHEYSHDGKSFKYLHKGWVKYEKTGELEGDDIFKNSPLAMYQCGTSSDNGTCYVPKNFLFESENYSIITLGGYVSFKTDDNANPLDDSGRFHCTGFMWKSPDGSWEEYDKDGRVISTGYKKLVLTRYEYDEQGKIQKILDTEGRVAIQYEYTGDLISAAVDRAGNRVEYQYTNALLTDVTDVLGNHWLYDYDSQGRLIQKTDPQGHKEVITYDYAGRVASVVDEQGIGKFFEYKYDKPNRVYYIRMETSGGLIKETWLDNELNVKRIAINGKTMLQVLNDLRSKIFIDEQGNRTVKYYNDYNNITKVSYPDGSQEIFEYDGTGKNIIKHVDRLGLEATYTYNQDGLISGVVKEDESGVLQTLKYTYDHYGNILTVGRTSSNGQNSTVTYKYDTFGNKTRKVDAQGSITEMTYDQMGNPVSIKDGNGNVWKLVFDARGDLLENENPLPGKIRREYDSVGNLTAVIFDTQRYEFRYDSHRRLIETIGPDGSREKYEYNADGKRTKVIDGEGKVTTYQYNTRGQLIKKANGNGDETRFEYGQRYTGECSLCSLSGGTSLVTGITYPTYSEHFEYDAVGRKVLDQIVLDESRVIDTAYEYNLPQRSITTTDSNDHRKVRFYDGLARITGVTDELGYHVGISYGWQGDMNYVADARNNVIALEYNKNDLLISDKDPMGQEIVYEYDNAGNMIEKRYPDGARISYEYDEANRLVRSNEYDASQNLERQTTFSYNHVGIITGYNDGITSAQFTYDPLFRKNSETVNYGEFSLNYSYQYYRNGKIKSLTVTDASGASYTVEYSYDGANYLSAINIGEYGSVTYSDYLWKKPRKKVFPGGVEEALAYDNIMRIIGSEIKEVGGRTISAYQYSHDNAGNVISIERDGEITDYNYDALDRLIQADGPGSNDESYAYDPAGNRTSDHRFASQWTYNNNNQLLSYGDVTLSYNQNGACVEKRENSTLQYQFIYNARNRLSEVKDGAGNTIARYYYDPIGRRLKKDVQGQITYYLYSSQGLIGEFDSSGNFKKVYVYESGSEWSTAPVAMIENHRCYFYQNSPLGTPLILFSADGQVVWSATYESYGKAYVDPSSTITNNLRLPGQYLDAETGLHYNYKRFYDPETGRYISEDPTRLVGSLNMYQYARNNPLRYRDTRGESVSTSVSGGIGIGGVGLGVSVTECCKGNNYNRYWIASAKVGIGIINGVSGSVSYSPNKAGDCPPHTGCSPYPGASLGVGPFRGGCTSSRCSGGMTTKEWKLKASISIGLYYKCSSIVRTRFIRCCD